MAARKKQAIPSGLSRSEYSKEWWRLNPEKAEAYKKRREAKIKSSPEAKMRRLVQRARARAGKLGRECTLVDDHFELTSTIVERCQLLPKYEIEYTSDGLKPNSPSIDRLDPTRGYVPDNVWIVSNRANTLKGDATLEELEELCRNWRAELVRRGLREP